MSTPVHSVMTTLSERLTYESNRRSTAAGQKFLVYCIRGAINIA